MYEKINLTRTYCSRGRRYINSPDAKPCTNESSDPKAEGWAYFDSPGIPLTGWYCPSCTEGFLSILEEQGVKPTVTPLS
jgi:hypothetical protein